MSSADTREFLKFIRVNRTARWGLFGLAFSMVLLASLIDRAWLFRWQSLIAGFLALVAGGFALGSAWMVIADQNDQRNRLDYALIYWFEKDCSEWLKSIEVWFGFLKREPNNIETRHRTLPVLLETLPDTSKLATIALPVDVIEKLTSIPRKVREHQADIQHTPEEIPLDMHVVGIMESVRSLVECIYRYRSGRADDAIRQGERHPLSFLGLDS